MVAYKVDPELNQVAETKQLINSESILTNDLGTSDSITIFSNSEESSVWINDELLSDEGKPLIRLVKRKLSNGVEYTIIPLRTILQGSIFLIDPNGTYQYNLMFKYYGY